MFFLLACWVFFRPSWGRATAAGKKAEIGTWAPKNTTEPRLSHAASYGSTWTHKQTLKSSSCSESSSRPC